MTTKEVSIETAKKIFIKAGCTGLLALVEYLEQDFEEKGEKLFQIHVTYKTGGGISIGNPAKGQTCLMWCQEFARNISKLSAKRLLEIDLAILEMVEVSKTAPCAHPSKVF